MKRKRNIVWLILALAILATAGYLYYNRQIQSTEAAPTAQVQTARVRLGDIVITASGAGNVVPAQEVNLGFRSGGIITELNVGVGDPVNAGQVLASLDDTAIRMQLEQSQISLQALISPSAVNEAEIAELNAETALEDAIDQLEYQISPAVWNWENKLQIAQADLAKLQTTPETSAETLAEAEKAIEKTQANLKYAQYLYKEEYVPETFYYTYTDSVTGEEVTALVPPTEADIALARAKVKSAQQNVQDDQKYANQLKADQPCSDLTAVVAAEGAALSKLAAACVAVEAAELDLDNAHLLAPFSGTVTGLSASVGQVVGTVPIVTIATTDQLLVRFYVDENDLSRIAVGNPVVLTFDAFPGQEVQGKVTQVDPALVTVDGIAMLRAWASLKTELNLVSGMAADVEVTNAEAHDTLLVPVQALKELDLGKYAVFVVKADGDLALRPVTVGLKDFANAQILSGIKVGEIVSTGTIETQP